MHRIARNVIAMLFVLPISLAAQVRWPLPLPAPAGTTSESSLVSTGEPGEPLAISSAIVAPDGRGHNRIRLQH